MRYESYNIFIEYEDLREGETLEEAAMDCLHNFNFKKCGLYYFDEDFADYVCSYKGVDMYHADYADGYYFFCPSKKKSSKKKKETKKK